MSDEGPDVATYAGDEWQGSLTWSQALFEHDRLTASASILLADYQPKESVGVYRDTRVLRHEAAIGYVRVLSPKLEAAATYFFRDYDASGNSSDGEFSVHVLVFSLQLKVW